MPAHVHAVLHEPGLELPLQIQEWRMYDVPPPGSHYWHGRTGYLVLRVEQTDPVTVHFVRDPEWEQELHAGLPDDHIIDGGRGSDDGTWHFSVVGPSGQLNEAWAFGDQMEPAIREAVALARTRLAQTGQATA